MQDEELLSIKQVARRLGVDDKTVRRWIKSGQLPAIELGGRYRIYPSDLKEFENKRRVPPPQKS